MDWLHRSHRAEKRRQDSASHGRPYSSKESSLEQDVASCMITLRVKESTKCRTHRNGKPRKRAPRPARRRKSGEVKGRPSHIRRAGLRDDPLQHFTRNTRNTQVRCNKGKQLSTFKRGKFEHKFSDPVSSILKAEDL